MGLQHTWDRLKKLLNVVYMHDANNRWILEHTQRAHFTAGPQQTCGETLNRWSMMSFSMLQLGLDNPSSQHCSIMFSAWYM